MNRLRAALAAVLLAAAGGWGCGREEAAPAPGEPSRPPHVFLLALDTLRADAVGAVDAGGVSVTPHLDALARRSTSFSDVVSEMPFTLTAHMTLLTGTAPDVHGVFGEGDRLHDALPTLAEILAAAGYRTAAVVSSNWLGATFGFARGFERFEGIEERLDFGDRVHRAAWRSFDALAADGDPVFLFAHYYDAHSDFARYGNDRPYWSPDDLAGGLPEACREGLCAPDGGCATGYLLWANRHPEEVSPEVRHCLHQSYLAGVRALDASVGAFVAEIEKRELFDGALLVVTSDHGEEFGEHGQFIHAQTHRETTRVPLLIRAPGRVPGRRAERAQLADVLPTILAAVGSEVPATVTGRRLFDDGGEVPPALAQNKYRPQRYAWIEARWKLVHDYVSGESRLYDLAADPGEATDLGALRPEVVERLRRRLDRHLRDLGRRREAAGGGAVEAGELPDEVRRRLEALGYVD